ncbi:carbon-nitrogen hydrolase family protein [uncultured Sphingomonas sp.]|uniref:carbon-nitrogen hydrolase family protein n=1 Tax=uncultured Sphingomonas sp. TaxID=158754 RepID=UPI0026229130|nr:carbon-nitrogen hydrolase family protein [uncultured Sphingomonas sp.]
MRIGVLQMTSGIDPAVNARAVADAIAASRAEGAAMVFTPEMSGLLDQDPARAAAAIVTEDEDRVLAVTREAAAKHGVWVHLGSLAVRRDDGRYANRGFVIDDRGVVRSRYDKMHLFDVDLPTGERWRESARYAGGEAAVAVDTPVGRLGLAICYDLRFPALFAALAEAGATVISVPAAFTRPTGAAHWHILLRARAIEAGVHVVAAAQAGLHDDGRATYGHSLLVDPWGEVLLDLGEAAGLGLAEIDATRTAEVRARVPALSHRRPIPAVQVVPA